MALATGVVKSPVLSAQPGNDHTPSAPPAFETPGPITPCLKFSRQLSYASVQTASSTLPCFCDPGQKFLRLVGPNTNELHWVCVTRIPFLHTYLG